MRLRVIFVDSNMSQIVLGGWFCRRKYNGAILEIFNVFEANMHCSSHNSLNYVDTSKAPFHQNNHSPTN